ncbi:hypothetical protein PBAL39_04708 [Pedobacter sp. BAL39]|nr:hypothetical protein PBAL39_04708 [Pedobacter sp. BAL39]
MYTVSLFYAAGIQNKSANRKRDAAHRNIPFLNFCRY